MPFKPGQSGNPGGRPKIVREFHSWLTGKAYPEAKKALLKCLKSDDEKVQMLAVKEVNDRLFGKSPQPLVGEDGGPVGVSLLEPALRALIEKK